MFPQASVSHSVHRRGGYLWYQVPSGGYVGDGYVWRGGEVCEGVGMSGEGDRYVKGVGMSSGGMGMSRGLGMSGMGTHRSPQK